MTTTRVTNDDLAAICKRLNEMTNSPTKAMQTIGNKHIHCIGHFHTDSGFGGVTLRRMTSTTGGSENVLNTGYISRKDMHNRIYAFIRGIEYAKGL